MIQAHYTPNGSPQIDQSEVGLVFADTKEVKKEITVAAAINTRFRHSGGRQRSRRPRGASILTRTSLLFAVTPHMHLRGKAFRFEAIYPDGREEVLLDVPRYDFNWQNTYNLAEPKPMPQGTEIRCTARFDNSADNPANPDPATDVSWGDQTWQEMVVGTMDISSLEQDLSLGMPSIKPLGDGQYEVKFTYQAQIQGRRRHPGGQLQRLADRRQTAGWARCRRPLHGDPHAQARRLPVQVRARRQALACRSRQPRPCRSASEQPAARGRPELARSEYPGHWVSGPPVSRPTGHRSPRPLDQAGQIKLVCLRRTDAD